MTTVLFFFLVLVFFRDKLCYSFCSFFCMHTFVCMGGVAHVCGCLWRPEVDMDVVLDLIPLLSTETGCLAEPRAHQLSSLPSHLSLDPCSYLLSAGIAGRLSCLRGFYVDAGKCFTHWASPQPHYCGILTEIFCFPHSFYIYLLGCFWKEGLFLIPV